jgi:hypothetical protein
MFLYTIYIWFYGIYVYIWFIRRIYTYTEIPPTILANLHICFYFALQCHGAYFQVNFGVDLGAGLGLSVNMG